VPGFVVLRPERNPAEGYSCLPWTINAHQFSHGKTALAYHRAGEPEPDIVVPVSRIVVVAVGGTNVDCIVVPRAAAKNTVSNRANRLWG